MAHSNDTLRGRLLAWTLPEDAEIRHSFGYWRMVEKRMIRAEWTGHEPPTPMDIDRAIQANHAHDETYAETSKRLSRKWAEAAESRWQAGEGERSASFTKPELEFLADHFAGENDPVAASILAKVLAALV